MDKTFFIAILLAGALFCREVTFNDNIIEGETITIKGYLAKREDGWALLPVPGVKTCCPLPSKSFKLEGNYSENPFKVFKIEGVYSQGVIKPTKVE
jgi:hypothetical protein